MQQKHKIMDYSNSPHTVYNSLITGQSNMFLSSSMAIAMIGFVSTWPLEGSRTAVVLRLVAICIFIMSIFIGLQSLSDFNVYMEAHKGDLPDYIPVKQWGRWRYVTYIYTAIIAVVATSVLVALIPHSVHIFRLR